MFCETSSLFIHINMDEGSVLNLRLKLNSCSSFHQIPTNLHLPRGQIETSLEAAKDVNLGLWPDVLDASLDPLHHTGAHVVLLGAGHHPLEEVLDLLMQPAHCSQLERPDGSSAIFPWQWMYGLMTGGRILFWFMNAAVSLWRPWRQQRDTLCGLW